MSLEIVSDLILANRYIGFLDFAGKDIDHLPTLKNQIGGDFPPSGADEFLEFFDGHKKELRITCYGLRVIRL